MKKRVLAIIMAIMVAAVFCLSACGASGPDGSVKAVLEAFKKNDTKTLEKYYAGELEGFSTEELHDFLMNSIAIPGPLKDDLELLAEKTTDFDVVVKNTEMLDDDSAVVTVEIKTYDYKVLFSTILDEFSLNFDIGKLFSGIVFGDNIYEHIAESIYPAVEKGVKSLKEKTVSTDVDFKVEKNSEGTWVVQEVPEEFMMALLSNIMEAMEEAQERMEKMFDLGF